MNEPRRKGCPAVTSGSGCRAYRRLSEAREELARNGPLRQIGAVVIVGVAMSLIGVNSGVQAQQAPQPRIRDPFVTVGGYHITLNQIRYVKQELARSSFWS
jgi:hypothetical protein